MKDTQYLGNLYYNTAGFYDYDNREIINVLTREDKELFVPEQIFKVQVNNIPNYPKGVKTADMRGIESLPEKERLLEKWKY